MKYLLRFSLFLLAACFSAAAARGAGVHVRDCSNSSLVSGTTITCTFGAASASGNSILLGMLWANPSNQTVTCADPKGNTYTASYTQVDVPGTGNVILQQFSAVNITGGGAAIVITCTLSGANSEKYIVASEFSGMPTSALLDKFATNATTTASVNMTSTATTTTAQADEVLYGCAGQEQGVVTIAAQSGWTLVANPSGQFACQYQIVAATSTYTSIPVQSVAEPFTSGIATYKAAVAGGTPAPVKKPVVF